MCLQDPQKAIPKGTLLAIILSNLTYLGMAILVGTVVIRNAPGAPEDYFNTNANFTCDMTSNDTISYFIASAGEMMCGVTPFNITENFPACAGAIEEVEGGACYPSSCLYEDSSRDNLQTLCNEDFLRLVQNRTGGNPRCEFGLLNNFQVCRS